MTAHVARVPGLEGEKDLETEDIKCILKKTTSLIPDDSGFDTTKAKRAQLGYVNVDIADSSPHITYLE